MKLLKQRLLQEITEGMSDDTMEILPMVRRGIFQLKKNTAKCGLCKEYININEQYQIFNRNREYIHHRCLNALFHLGFSRTGEINVLPTQTEKHQLIYIQVELYESVFSFEMCAVCGDKIEDRSYYYKHLSCKHKMCYECFPKHVIKYGFDINGKLFCELCKLSKLNEKNNQ